MPHGTAKKKKKERKKEDQMKIEPQTPPTPTSLPIFTLQPRLDLGSPWLLIRAQNTCFAFFMELCSTCIIHMLAQLTFPICLAVPYGWPFVVANSPLLSFQKQLGVYIYIYFYFLVYIFCHLLPIHIFFLLLFLKLFQNVS